MFTSIHAVQFRLQSQQQLLSVEGSSLIRNIALVDTLVLDFKRLLFDFKRQRVREIVMPYHIRTAALSGFPGLVRKLGGEPDALLREFGVSPELINAEDKYIPYRQFVYLLEETATRLGRRDLGLLFAQQQDLRMLGPLALAMQNCDTVEEAQSCAVRYLYAHTPAVSYDAQIGETESCLVLTTKLTNISHREMVQAEDHILAFTHLQVRMLAGSNYKLLRVELPHPAYGEETTYQKFFGAPVVFDAWRNALTVTTRTLKSPLMKSSKALYDLAISYLSARGFSGVTSFDERVELAIRRSIGTDSCNRDAVAAALSVHPRTLQRRLALRGETFNGILDRLRCERAEYYLCETDLPFSQISLLLGYQEQAIFSRSCRRWFNASPSNLRSNSKRPVSK